MPPIQVFAESAIEILAICLILSILKEPYWIHKWKILILILFLSTLTTITDYFGIPMNLGLNVVSTAFGLFLLYRDKLLNCIFDVIFSGIILATIEMTLLFALSLWSELLLENDIAVETAIVGMVFLLWLVKRSDRICRWIQKKYDAYQGQLRWIAVNIAVLQGLYLYVWNENGARFGADKWILVTLVFAILITNIILMVKMLESNRQKITIIKQTELDQMRESFLEELSMRQHEFSRHMQAIRELTAMEDKNDAANEIKLYIDDLTIDREHLRQSSYIGGGLVAAFIASKKKEAAANRIQFTCFGERALEQFPCSRSELIEILGNLIDNAFEAVGTLAEDKKKVYLEIGKENGRAYVKVMNHIKEDFDPESEDFWIKGYTTKSGTGHGYGLHNVQQILKTYGGSLSSCCKEDKLEVIALF